MVVLAVILLAAIVAVMNKDSQVLLWNYMSMALRGGIFLPLTLTIFRQHAVGSHCAILSMTISTAVAVIAAIVDSPVPPLFIGLGTSFLFLAAGYITHHGEAGLSAR
jgi:SSS family solute:Na+ symporter